MIDSEKKISYSKSKEDIIEISEIKDSYKGVCKTFCKWLTLNDIGLNLYSFKKYYWLLINDHKEASTINTTLCMMKKRFFYVFDKTNNLIDKRAIFDYKVKLFKAPSKVSTGLSKEKLFSKQEINRMISMTGPRTSLMVEFLYSTACRRAELCGILLKDCKDKRHHINITIYGKGNKTRKIPIKKDLYKRILNVFKGKKYLFETGKNEKYTGKTIWAMISEPSERVINRHMSPHMLRHSRVTHLRSESKDLKATSLFAGHSSTAVTADIYDHTEFDAKTILGGVGDQ